MSKNKYIKYVMERNIFRTALILSTITVSLLMILDLTFYHDMIAVAIESTCIVIFIVMFLFEVKNKQFRILVITYIAVLFIALNLAWLFSGGMITAMALLFLIAIYISNLIIPRRLRKGFIVIYSLNILTLMVLEFYIPGIRNSADTLMVQIITSHIFLIISGGLGAYLIVYAKDNYSRAREIIEEQNRKLHIQSLELVELNEEMKTLNDMLEEQVRERTLEMRKKNKMLLHYAFTNSHKIRGPLVRIVGLANLYKDDRIALKEIDYTLNALKLSAVELKKEIEEVKMKLKDETEGLPG